jgi:hypothetical protein
MGIKEFWRVHNSVRYVPSSKKSFESDMRSKNSRNDIGLNNTRFDKKGKNRKPPMAGSRTSGYSLEKQNPKMVNKRSSNFGYLNGKTPAFKDHQTEKSENHTSA